MSDAKDDLLFDELVPFSNPNEIWYSDILVDREIGKFPNWSELIY